MIPFAEWLPDLPALDNPGATEAKNVLPGAKSYLPLPDISPITDAMDAFMRGGIAVRDKDDVVYNYAGNETKLYSISADTHSDKTNVGGAYALSDEENWEFQKWGEKLIAVAIDEPPQIITLAGSNFADLAGSPPKARHIAVINNFVVLANLNEGGTLKPQKVRWSAIDDETDWTASATTQSDSQELKSDAGSGGGFIMGITGGEWGNIFQEYSIWRMTYVGSGQGIFQIEEVLPGVGTPAKNSITQEGRYTHFLSQEGFVQLIDGFQIKYIGKEKIDATFFADVNDRYMHRIVGGSDPTSAIVSWIYPSTSSSDGTPDKIICYNWFTERWTHGAINLEWIYQALGQGFTLEGLDAVSSSIDALTPTLDSRAWVGGALQLAIYDTSHKKGVLGGTALSAIIETAEAMINPGKRTQVTGVRPLVDGATTLTVQIGTRELQDDAVAYGSALTPHSSTGIAPARSDSRYHRFRVNTVGGFTHAQGIDVEQVESSYR